MNPILCGIPNRLQAISADSTFRHPDFGKPHNRRMGKLPIRQILARNLQAAIDKSSLVDNQRGLALRSGVSPSHLSEIMRGISSVTVDLLADLAGALGLQPWELLADSEETKRAALARMMWGGGIPDKEVEKHLPLPPKPAPAKEVAPKRKKPGRNAGRPEA